ncbi:hypothetical protein, partial [Bacillus cereus]|uniref:hypothetical protein n=1 Tax=Bacillus cereus TaxID=1396 RepID=UPI0005393A8B
VGDVLQVLRAALVHPSVVVVQTYAGVEQPFIRQSTRIEQSKASVFDKGNLRAAFEGLKSGKGTMNRAELGERNKPVEHW